MLLTQNNNHVFICGITRSGKTYFAKEATAQLSRPVLFFNIQDEKLNAPFLDIDYKSDLQTIKRLLKKGCKFNFNFGNLGAKDIMLVMGYIMGELMTSKLFSQGAPLYIVIDEAQILEGEALKAAIEISTRGLSRGLRLISITQRPALVNKTIYTQAAEQYLFRLAPSEKQYLQNKGIDYDFCLKEWGRLGEHSYIFSNGFELKGYKSI